MGIINGVPLKAEQVGLDRRVVVRLKAVAQEKNFERDIKSTRFLKLDLEPYVPSAQTTELFGIGTARFVESAASRLQRYFTVTIPGGKDEAEFISEMSLEPEVEMAELPPKPSAPPANSINPTDDPRFRKQGYLDPAPKGIDAKWAWQFTAGAGIGLVDVEQGWALNHEDLVAASISVISGFNRRYRSHGTAVLGQLCASDNKVGGLGIAPASKVRVVSEWRRDDNGAFVTADAIASAAAHMNFGDVLLIESQMSLYGYIEIPVEVWAPTFDAIRAATDKGIIVVEAAGNGANDLDRLKLPSGKHMLNQRSADFQDSGAIMVGAGESFDTHKRSRFSNYGTRIDCFGWGDNIDTCGDFANNDDPRAYIPDFGGTSGAAPMVAGAALLLQSWVVANGKSRLSPDMMRLILSDAAINTKSANPAIDRIGVMPNLKGLMSRVVG